MLFGFRIPCPLPIGLPAGITLAAPASFNRFARTGSSLVYTSTVNPSFTNCSVAFSVSIGSGSSVRLSARHSSFTHPAPGFSRLVSSSRASRAWRIASSALKHPAVFGRIVSFFRSRKSRMLLPSLSMSRSRRTATVVTSHPLAAMHCCIRS